MKRILLLAGVLLSFSGCNQSDEHKPETDGVVKDTQTQTAIMRPFNAMPAAQNIYVTVDPKEENYLSDRDPGVNQLLSHIKGEGQYFLVSSTTPSEVKGKRGTKVFFNAHSFVSKTGKEVTLPIEIELKECYSVDEMLNENVTTTSDKKIMESKGMVCINAMSGGEQLSLKKGEKINIRFPYTMKEQNGYRFFYGKEQKDGEINWTPQENNNSEDQTAALPEENDATAKGYTKPEFSFNGLNLENYLHEALVYPDEAKRNELSAKVEVNFYVTETGRVKDINTGGTYKIFRDEITRVLNNIPKWRSATYKGKNIPSMVHVDVDFNIRRPDQIWVDFDASEVSLVKSGKSCYVVYGNDLSGKEKKGYEKTFDRMGWVSCQRAVNLPGRKADVLVNSDSRSQVRIILKNKNTIIGGEDCVGYSRFKNLPVNEEVYVVAVKNENGNIYYAIQPLKLSTQNVVSLAWKRGDEAEIKRAYMRLSV